jgi:hypothetical protein
MLCLAWITAKPLPAGMLEQQERLRPWRVALKRQRQLHRKWGRERRLQLGQLRSKSAALSSLPKRKRHASPRSRWLKQAARLSLPIAMSDGIRGLQYCLRPRPDWPPRLSRAATPAITARARE